MARITWNDGLRTGVIEVDRQHENLIGMINALERAAETGQGKDAISEIIDGLIIYTATHFRMEEKYFARFEYADAVEHKLEHGVFIKKVGKFAREVDKASDSNLAGLIAELIEFLGMWWNYHILESDMKYARLFREKGLK